MLSVLNLMILRLDVDSVEDSADFGSAGANPADDSKNFLGKNLPMSAVCASILFSVYGIFDLKVGLHQGLPDEP